MEKVLERIAAVENNAQSKKQSIDQQVETAEKVSKMFNGLDRIT